VLFIFAAALALRLGWRSNKNMAGSQCVKHRLSYRQLIKNWRAQVRQAVLSWDAFVRGWI